MKIEKLLKRLRREFIKVNVLQASLDSLIFFLAGNLFLFLSSTRLLESVSNTEVLGFLTLVFLSGDLAYRYRNYRLEIYEEENPELQEVLRTARDNIDRENVVSQALFDEVVSRARSVTSDSIVPSKRIIQKILVVGGLSFLTVISGITGLQLGNGNGSISELGFLQDSTQKDNFTVRNASLILEDPENIDYKSSINFSIEGNGNADRQGITTAGREEQFRYESSPETLGEDLGLAKRYSLEIKKIS